jgi:alpha-tubulin suppressor-like RCC1 family protein
MTRRALLLLSYISGLLAAPSLALAQSVAAGDSHTVLSKPDGTVWAWGYNSSGQLGDGSTTERRTPVQVTGLSNIVAVAAGQYHTLALGSDGTVWSWGYNSNGQLGTGTTTGRSTPGTVLGLPVVVAISAGATHSVALGSDGTIWIWGLNTNGQLGNGTTTRSLQPIPVTTGWIATAIGAGSSHTLAVRDDGTLWAWGANASGQLGDGTTTQRTLPVQVSGVAGAVAAVGGSCHTAVLRNDGRVLTTGCNSSGQLGDNTTTSRQSMALVSTLVNVASVSAGGAFTSALTTAGEVWSWGQNLYGQIGDGTTSNRLVPVRTLTSDVIGKLAAGSSHAIAASTAGVVFTWGSNGNGRLGDGTTLRRTSPTAISDINYVFKVATPTLSLNAGGYSTDQTVVIAVATPDAEIHYSITGADPALSDPVIASGGSLAVDRTMTLKVRAWKSGMPPSNIEAATYTMTVATPSVSPAGGTYTAPQTVSISTTTAGTTLRYTTNGSNPDATSPVYTPPLQISTTTQLRVVGFRDGWTNSGVRSATYTMNFGALAAPVISPSAGSYTSSVTVTISAFAGATIRYTTNGTNPTTFSPQYTGPLAVSTTQTIKAIATHPDYTTSPISTSAFTIVVAAPVFTPGGGTYTAGQLVSVTSDTAGATIRYTIDGRDPTDTDPIIASGSTLVVGNYTLKAKASKTGATTSAITTAVYQLNGQLTSPQVEGGLQRSILVRPDGLAWVWGSQPGALWNHVLPVPIANASGTITGITSASVGGGHLLVSVLDGAVYAWGSNFNGQVGDGTTSVRSSPVRLTTIAGVSKVSAGGVHSVAVKQDGSLWAWGANSQGQVGDGTTVQRPSPVAVPGLTNVTAVAAGDLFSLALKTDGSVWSWGDNQYGQLGDGTNTDRLQPVRITGLSNIVAISAGRTHAMALRNNGSLWVWGDNTLYQLGTGTTVQERSPVALSGLPSIAAIAGGGGHSLALGSNGAVWAWGHNNRGQMGDGTTQIRTTPAQVNGLPNIVAIGAGDGHSLAIGADGSVWAWGGNDYGEVGDGTEDVDRLLPVQISGAGYNWKVWTPSITPASGLYTAAQTAVITLQDPNATIHYTVNGAEPTESDPVIASGGTVAITQSTTLKAKAWKVGAPSSATAVRSYELQALFPNMSPGTGSYSGPQSVTITNPNAAGTITYTLDGTQPTPASTVYTAPITVDRTMTVKAAVHIPGWTSSVPNYRSYWVTDGAAATPTFTPPGGAYVVPQLVHIASATASATIRYTLDGTDPNERSPVYLFPLMVSASSTLKARAFKPGMTPSGVGTAVYALDSAGSAATPTLVPGGGRFTVRQTVSVQGPGGATFRYTTDGRDPTDTDPIVGAGGTIAVDRSQVVKVRGWQAGVAPSAVRSGFFVITGAVSAGYRHSMALKTDGTVWTWGDNYYGTLGDGTTTTRFTPVQVGIADVQAISAGHAFSLALKRDGTVWAWGANGCGQLGDNTTTSRTTPVQVLGLTDAIAIAAGGHDIGLQYSHSLALKSDGSVWAWGCNQMGQLGDGTNTTRRTPVRVLGIQGISAIAAFGRHSFAVESNGGVGGRVWAWGDNQSGQLGDGSVDSRIVPVAVAGVTDVVDIATGWSDGIALRRDGTVWHWGNGGAKLLDMPTTLAPFPLMERIVAIAVGSSHALAVSADGVRWGVGLNVWGELGNGGWSSDLLNTMVAARVAENADATLQADGGNMHSLFLRANGTVAAAGEGDWGRLGNGSNTDARVPATISGFTVADNAWLAGDGDYDGLPAWQEWLAGTDPYRADTNANGIPDGVEFATGPSAGNPDTDSDGLTNWVELQAGTDPFVADTDGDGAADGVDIAPLDPTRSSLPPPNPSDTTPPTITLTEPRTARPVGGG